MGARGWDERVSVVWLRAEHEEAEEEVEGLEAEAMMAEKVLNRPVLPRLAWVSLRMGSNHHRPMKAPGAGPRMGELPSFFSRRAFSDSRHACVSSCHAAIQQ